MRLRSRLLLQLLLRFNPRICKRCDFCKGRHVLEDCSFNPRICKRCDYIDIPFRHATSVSIHASVKDATYPSFCSSVLKCFNPRICKRCDFQLSRFLIFLPSFNPRICKRCDFLFFCSQEYLYSFNPRICKRCDRTYLSAAQREIEFQSTHL